MNSFSKCVLLLVAATSVASTAFAAPGETAFNRASRAQAYIGSLESQFDSIEVSVDTNSTVAATGIMSKNSINRERILQLRSN